MKPRIGSLLAVIVLSGVQFIGCKGADGSGCSVSDNGDGTGTITCTDGSSYTVENGTSGSDGATGATGADGSDGSDGTACTVKDNTDGTKTIECEDGTSVTVTDGTNGKSCTVTDNGDGTETIACEDGSSVTVTNGSDGLDGGDFSIENFHGEQAVAEELLVRDGMYLADVAITANPIADAAGKVTVDFTVEDAADGAPVLNVTTISANIAKLIPASTGVPSSVWVPYIYRTQTTAAGSHVAKGWPAADGTSAIQAYKESNGVLTNHHDGSYTYVFATNLSSAMMGTTPITYERNKTHRVSIMLGGHSGPTGTITKDFVPDGTSIVDRREIMPTDTCYQCHGKDEFKGHGGDRRTLENCVTCHVPTAFDPQSGESLDMKVMIHKIHAGGALMSSAGADGIVWDNPGTALNENADNGIQGIDAVRRPYTIWGYGDAPITWWKINFPGEAANCTKCHQGSPVQVDNWKQKPSRAVCGSCHDLVKFADGTNHPDPGGAQLDDTGCVTCHVGTSTTNVALIQNGHNFEGRDARLVAEFDAALTVTGKAGAYFVPGESPVVHLVLKKNNAPIDHTTIVEDDVAEGCWTSWPPANYSVACNPGDGKFTAASLFVEGPRGNRVPVLTSAARAQEISATTGPWDLSAANASLIIKVDAGRDVFTFDSSGGDVNLAGNITVAVPATTTWTKTAATPADVAGWLNADAKFKARAIAEVFATGPNVGKLSIRSRNLGLVYGMQNTPNATGTPSGLVNAAIFGTDVSVHLPTGSTPTNNTSSRITVANNDPKVTRVAGELTYQLDPVDNLPPGTYTVSIEFKDGGASAVSGQADNYRSPTIGFAKFQVGTATEELPPAGNCQSCHENAAGQGLIVDPLRHKKLLNNLAPDQCGACHDYMPQNATGTTWSGAGPISRRVHAIHYGSSLNYPLTTVGYSNGDTVKGRNWEITLPQDVRNCEVCHPSGTTSGSWATDPARIPCMGCHDSDAATAHFRSTTYDPTPADAWSGDEQEACDTCHAP